MKNVLIITTVSGFLEKFEKNNVKILQDMGYTIHYAANMNEQQYPFDVDRLKADGVILHHIDIEKSPYMVLNNSKAYRQLRKIIEDNSITLIHCHNPVGGFVGRCVARKFRKRGMKVIYTAHGFHFYKGAPFINRTAYKGVERLMARNTDTLIVINDEDYQYSKTLKLRKGGQVYKIPGVGLDLEKFKPYSAEEINKRRKELDIAADEHMIVTVGELNENKNQYVILEAVAKLIAEKPQEVKIKCFICGEGFYSDKIDNWIREMKLEGYVVKCGYQRDVRKIIGCADAFVFPSKREGLGMAALEALAMGIPAIVSDNRGTREYIVDGKNGYVCQNNIAQEYVDNIKRVIAMTPEKRKTLNKNCRESAKSFDQSNTIEIMKEVYEKIERM